jgi:uncharacterized repeat protein (TIGR03803 family)
MRTQLTLLNGVVITVGISCVLAGYLRAQTVSELHIFTGSPDGAYPSAILVQGRDGYLYGTTQQGGANTCDLEGYTTSCGTIFKMDVLGNVTLLHSFNGTDGSGPEGVILASDGYFYGATATNGAYGFGTLFRITANGTFTKLHDFTNGTDGGYPEDQLLQASDGNLYGFAETGLYRASTSGTVTTIYPLSPGLPRNYSPLIQATNGYLYQTMPEGWCHGNNICPAGSIAEFSLQGALVGEHDFVRYNTTDGWNPYSPVTQAADGNFYDTAIGGGTADAGTAFTLNPRNGAFNVLYTYTSVSINPYAGLAEGSDGNFYGVTAYSTLEYSGTVNEITPSGVYTELAPLPYHGEDWPYWKFLAHTNGKFYSSVEGAENQPGYYGSVYSLDNGLAPFIAFVNRQARIGGTAQILGQGLTGTSAVAFNGVAATSFLVVSDTYMTAVVPSGATPGPVTVTTPTGTLTSISNFQIGH